MTEVQRLSLREEVPRPRLILGLPSGRLVRVRGRGDGRRSRRVHALVTLSVRRIGIRVLSSRAEREVAHAVDVETRVGERTSRFKGVSTTLQELVNQ